MGEDETMVSSWVSGGIKGLREWGRGTRQFQGPETHLGGGVQEADGPRGGIAEGRAASGLTGSCTTSYLCFMVLCAPAQVILLLKPPN